MSNSAVLPITENISRHFVEGNQSIQPGSRRMTLRGLLKKVVWFQFSNFQLSHNPGSAADTCIIQVAPELRASNTGFQ